MGYICGSYHNVLKAIFYPLTGNCKLTKAPGPRCRAAKDWTEEYVEIAGLSSIEAKEMASELVRFLRGPDTWL